MARRRSQQAKEILPQKMPMKLRKPMAKKPPIRGGKAADPVRQPAPLAKEAQPSEVTDESVVVVPPEIRQNSPSISPPSTTALATVKPEREWVWTKSKKDALKLTLEGHPIGKIAERIGKHRETVRNWWKAPEFGAQMYERANEGTVSARLREAYRTGVRAEALYELGDKLIAEAVAGKKLDVGAAQIVLRGFLEAQRESRELREGTAPKRVEHNVTIQTPGNFFGQPETKVVTSRASMPLVAFLEQEGLIEEVKKLPPGTQEEMENRIAHLIVDKTTIVDEMNEELRAHEKERNDALAPDNRRR